MTTLVDEHPHLGVEPILRELHIPSSTYYRWRRAETDPCERRRQDAALTEKIRQSHEDSGGIYGSRNIHTRPLSDRSRACYAILTPATTASPPSTA